ncbi:HlyD family efflux transporter periplasmic adaptor subunit [Proteinivorax hydrogeniformans]|uniref:HlyD family efflux transporter periplasmic adaptor subunit n=1 Tax=Proteinivorax hydrogeniformans TaxID=1826727 RepID=A0AAU8HPJ9_9FIRM
MNNRKRNSKGFSVVSGGKAKNQNPNRPSPIKAVIFFVIAAVFLFLASQGFLWIRDFAVSQMIITEHIEMASAQRGVYGDGVFLWDEKVVYSPTSGSLDTEIKQFQRVRKEQIIGTVGQTEIETPKSGLIVFYNDGLEYIETGLDNRELINVFEQQDDYARQTISSSSSGEPLFKVIDNFNSDLIVKMQKEKFEKMQELSSVRVKIISESVSQMLTADIFDSVAQGDYAFVHLKPRNIKEDFFGERFSEVFFILDTLEGIKLPLQALVQHEGQEGVYLVNRNKVDFKEVIVMEKDSEYVWVHGLTESSEVILNPKLVNIGQKIR